MIRTRFAYPSCLLASLVLLGCPADENDPASTASDSVGQTMGEGTETADPGGTSQNPQTSGMDTDPIDPTTDTEGGSDTDPEETTGPGVTTGSFIDNDVGGIQVECSVWDQDCDPGEKCMPWANDGGNSWNATKCAPLDPNPAQPGDVCTVEGSGVSGVDNCDVGSMCWNVDPETNEGTCVGFCTGSDANPVCDDPSTACSITNEGVLILCLPACDPLLQDCADGSACYGIDQSFVCVPDASGETGLFGDPCEYVNACDPGLACVAAEGVPGCAGSQGCCSTHCDLSDPDASANCEGAAGGQECVPWFEEGATPPGFEDVGLCFIPA